MTEPPDLESRHWAVIHANADTPLNGVVDLTGVFFRWDLAVAWAARYFPDERAADVLPFELLIPEFEDEAAALGEVEPVAWVLIGRLDEHGAPVDLHGSARPDRAVGPFVNRHIALADFAVHPDRYAGYLAARANFGLVGNADETGENLPPA